MYRTDKQFMKNPATNSSRIYVGFLPKTIVADDLEAKFKVHGKILGLLLHKCFAFIQYEHDHEAQRAIEHEHGTLLHGQKINVRHASDRNQRGPNNQNRMNQPINNQQMPPKPMNQPPKPMPIQQQKPPVVTPEIVPENTSTLPQVPASTPQKTDVPPTQFNPDIEEESEQSFSQTSSQRDWDSFERKPHSNKRPHHNNRGNFNKLFRDENYYNGPVDDYIPPAQYPPVVDRLPDKNDCEIIVVSKNLTEYAEFIESRLKQLGLIVDLLFPNEDVPIGKVLANISSRGCLYAILVMPQNEEHRSITLNILHGIPQEHRNMPLEDALILIIRNFEAYMRGETTPVEKPGEMTLNDKHPVAMQMALNMLAENRALTTSQYDKLLKYLQERRDLQHEFEVSAGIEQESSQESTTKQAELQNRIMSILNNKAAEAAIPKSITSTESTTSPKAEPTPLLKDPTVQKALDSFLGDMLKKLS